MLPSYKHPYPAECILRTCSHYYHHFQINMLPTYLCIFATNKNCFKLFEKMIHPFYFHNFFSRQRIMTSCNIIVTFLAINHLQIALSVYDRPCVVWYKNAIKNSLHQTALLSLRFDKLQFNKRFIVLNDISQSFTSKHLAFTIRWSMGAHKWVNIKIIDFWFSRGNSFCHNHHAIPQCIAINFLMRYRLYM